MNVMRSRGTLALSIALVLGLAMLVLPRPVAAQEGAARLSRHFSGDTYLALEEHIDQAQQAGLPTETLVQKALEGRSKGAPDDQIVAAVARLHGRLAAARDVLGDSARTEELESAAAALYAGASPETLGKIRGQRSTADLAAAYTTLALLLQYGLGEDASSEAVGALVRADPTPAEFMAFQQALASDINAGRLPGESLRLRLEDFGRGRANSATGLPGGP